MLSSPVESDAVTLMHSSAIAGGSKDLSQRQSDDNNLEDTLDNDSDKENSVVTHSSVQSTSMQRRQSSNAVSTRHTSPVNVNLISKDIRKDLGLTEKYGHDPLMHMVSRSMFASRIESSRAGALYAGSRFVGEQTNRGDAHQVSVEILDVNLSQSRLSGYLHIVGLTEECVELTTYFEAEIIGPRYHYITAKWDSDSTIDTQHWRKFPALNTTDITKPQDTMIVDDYMFMRWKEYFLVPDHKMVVSGASFSGFYYMSYDVQEREFSGFYYSQHSAMYQRLNLSHVTDRSFASYEFR